MHTQYKDVKDSTHHFCLWNLLSGTLEWRKWKKDQKHQNEELIIFSLIFVNLSLAWNLYFYVWLQNQGKIVKIANSQKLFTIFVNARS